MTSKDETIPESAGVLVESSRGDFQSEVGSIFSLPVQQEYCIVSVSAGATLTITTAVLQELGCSCSLKYLELGGNIITLCPLSKEIPIVTGLGLTCSGPKVFRLCTNGGQINVFGSVSSNTIVVPENNDATKAAEPLENLTTPVVHVEESVDEEEKQKLAEPSSSKKRKLSKKSEETFQTETSIKTLIEKEVEELEEKAPEQLNKKQRRKLAKQKAKELEDAVAILNKHEKLQVQEGASKPKHVPSITKERRLKGGVLVRDFVIGTGAVVKAGRKLSILYEGRFLDGKVFDRNKSKANPLVFRQGTAQVVRGLEKGMDGMKVGGEREITIPPELGYGEKGSGAVIPPNSTLIFSVQLLSMG